MLKIGDFANLAQVTVKTLRHYDKLGLLKPVWVDRFTGYRYYSMQQLPRFNRILALKDLGFSLDEICTLLKQDFTAVQLRQMLLDKQYELADRIRLEQRRLEMVADRLQQIEHEGEWGGERYLGPDGQAHLLTMEKETQMEPQMITLPARTYVGLRYQGKNQHNEIGDLWGDFNH